MNNRKYSLKRQTVGLQFETGWNIFAINHLRYYSYKWKHKSDCHSALVNCIRKPIQITINANRKGASLKSWHWKFQNENYILNIKHFSPNWFSKVPCYIKLKFESHFEILKRIWIYKVKSIFSCSCILFGHLHLYVSM